MNGILKTILPHFLAVATFAVIASVFFGPAYQGYDLRQGDIAQFIGMSKEIVDFRELYDEEPLWTNSMFGGMPAYQISLLQSANVPKLILTSVKGLFPGPVGTLFLAMLSFYILGLCLRVKPLLAAGAAIAFGLSSIQILYLGAGHVSKVNAIALMPGVLGGVLLSFRGKAVAGATLTLLFLAMHLAANHLQMTYYLLFLIGAVVLTEVIRLAMAGETKRGLKAAGLLLIAGTLALLPNMANLATTYSYSKHTTRGTTELSIRPEGREDSASGERQDGLNKAYILEYSMARGEFLSLMVPDIKGGQSAAIGNDRDLLAKADRSYRENIAQSNRYWGAQRFTGGAFYLGALLMALFIVALFALRDALRWPFLLLSALAIMLSWKDSNFIGDLFIDHVPMFAKFRDTKMMLVLISVMAPTAVMLLLDQLGTRSKETSRKMLFAGAGAVLLVFVLIFAGQGSIFELISPEERAQFEQYELDAGSDPQASRFIQGFQDSLAAVRSSIVRSDAARSLVFALLGLGLLFAYYRRLVRGEVLAIAFALLVTIDSFSVDRRYLSSEKAGKDYLHWQPVIEKRYPHGVAPADKAVADRELETRTELLPLVREHVIRKQEEAGPMLETLKRNEREAYLGRVREAARHGILNLHSNYRVLNIRNPFSDARTSYFHKSLGGYHGAKLRRYQELIDFHLSDELERFYETANTLGQSVLAGMQFTNMLNTRYLILDPNSEPLPNPYAFGNAWFVTDIDYVESADEEILALEQANLREEAVVHRSFKSLVPTALIPDSSASIVLTDYLPNHLVYESNSSKEQLAVFSEIWYPDGWQAYIDGEQVDHLRANYVLRALRIPPGKHRIEFSFEPQSYERGTLLAGIGSGLFIVALLGALFMALKSRKLHEE